MASKVVRWIAICFLVASMLSNFENVFVNGHTFTAFNDCHRASHNYALAGLYCATYDPNQTLEWRKEYFWTAYCDKAAQPMEPSLHHLKIIYVTNKSTRQNVTVRIVDKCQNRGLVLETDAFNAIDKDGKGKHDGHMLTTYKFVGC
ncbi:pathogenesis-related protein PR-4-like [Cryptomeria japonica]|uniref:pathogenesis-related protein PR-4-like n=1 Tax=Cryptomeria japonica TaxID=3369 RepID=UPI0025AC1859|nr:pathogenesis-related protein PR-4-like [Cryptomeria japonica]